MTVRLKIQGIVWHWETKAKKLRQKLSTVHFGLIHNSFQRRGPARVISEANGRLEIGGKILYKSGGGGVYGLKT